MKHEDIQAKLHEIMWSEPVELNKQMSKLGRKVYATWDAFIRDENKTIYVGSTMQKELDDECFGWLMNVFGRLGRFICPIITRKNGAPFKRGEAKKYLKLQGCVVWEHSRLYNVRMVEWAFQRHYWNYLRTGSDDVVPEPGTSYGSRGYRRLNRGVAGGFDDRYNTGIVRGKVYFTFSFVVPNLLDDPVGDVMVGDYKHTKEYLIKHGTSYQKKMMTKLKDSEKKEKK